MGEDGQVDKQTALQDVDGSSRISFGSGAQDSPNSCETCVPMQRIVGFATVPDGGPGWTRHRSGREGQEQGSDPKEGCPDIKDADCTAFWQHAQQHDGLSQNVNFGARHAGERIEHKHDGCLVRQSSLSLLLEETQAFDIQLSKLPSLQLTKKNKREKLDRSHSCRGVVGERSQNVDANAQRQSPLSRRKHKAAAVMAEPDAQVTAGTLPTRSVMKKYDENMGVLMCGGSADTTSSPGGSSSEALPIPRCVKLRHACMMMRSI